MKMLLVPGDEVTAGALALAGALTDTREPKEWVVVAMTGRWDGHPKGGFEVTRAHLDEMVANNTRYSGGRLLFDYEHQTLRAQENGQPAYASGWGRELRIVETESGHALEARVEWTSRADTAIRAQEYAYLSPVYFWAGRDKRTNAPIGAVLHSVALTNNPFLTDLPAVAATDPLPETPMSAPSSLLPLLAGLLALSASATEDQVVERVRDLSTEGAALRTRLGLALTATQTEVEAKLVELSEQARVGAVALTHLPEGTTPDKAVTLLPPALGHAGYVALSDHEAVKADLDKLKAERLVERAEAAGKITQAQRNWLEGWALSDLTKAAAWVEVAPKTFPGAAQQRAGKVATPSASHALTDDERKTCAQLGVSEEDYLKQREADGQAA